LISFIFGAEEVAGASVLNLIFDTSILTGATGLSSGI
jgi:hypothetical protein